MSPALRWTRTATLVAALLAVSGASLAAQLVAEPALVDFGQVYEGEPTSGSVRFTNQGSEAIPVKRVSTTCGCTVATVTGPAGEALPAAHADPAAILVTLQPGESLEVGVQMVTANTVGLLEKLLQIFTGDGNLPPVSVTVRAHVSKAFVISPAVLSLGNIPKSGRLTHSVMLQAQLGDEWAITGIESSVPERPLPDWLQVTPLSESGAARELQLVLEGPRPMGPLFLRVRVLLAHERVPYVEFTLHGVVQADVSFDSGHANPSQRESLDFGQIEPEGQVVRTLTIVNHDPAVPYKLLSVDVSTKKGEYFETELRTLEEGVRYEVDLKADGRIGDTFFRGNLVLQAEHPDLKSKTISFFGWVKKSG